MSVLPLHHKNNFLAYLAGVGVFGLNSGAAQLASGGPDLNAGHLDRIKVLEAFKAGEGDNVCFHARKDGAKASIRLVK